ncbi:general transcription factor 3C polypeptide 5 [Schistocerca serialis cubense]|uniref:general transcription factor 3C polypeptide 5 n=1 Tax=Schistocerca serialis cubense TaxID=2023355 RepID=UPI00214F02EA|nr:general transcription factor 3C polypeptide 5 [Schistocerca serialis cubense]
MVTENLRGVDVVKEVNFEKTFISVEYPGVVQNVDNMLKTLGGIQNISTAYSQKNRRLELRFRPDDMYCKPACGDRHKSSSLLLKFVVKRKKKRKTCPDNELNSDKDVKPADQDSVVVSHVSVLGRIRTTFRFANLCDFQYLPMDRVSGSDGPMEDIYEKLVPKGLPSVSWLYGDSPYFLPPAVFSRMDSVQSYLYRKETSDDANVPHNIIGRTRRRRSGHAIFVTYDITKVPKRPREIAVKCLQLKFLTGEHYRKMQELFNERPVWSKNALIYITKFTVDQMKYLLPAVAYYVVTGPWRVMWVRFGYDPRQDPGSRKYQTLDYRLRAFGGLKTKVKAKRSYCNYLLPYKSTPASRPRVATITKDAGPSRETTSRSNFAASNENVYIFRPGMLPPSRQMFYQFCDLHVPQIQAMLEKLPEPPADAKCHERTGWMPKGIDAQCREIINNLVTQVLRNEVLPDSVKLMDNNSGTSNDESEELDDDEDDVDEEDDVDDNDDEDDGDDDDEA